MRSRRTARGPAMRGATAVVWLIVAADLLLLLWILLTSLRSAPDILNHPFGLPTRPQFGNWNETLFALVLTSSPDKITLPVAMANFVNAQQMNSLNYGTMFAGICVIVAPMIALFSWMGSRIIQGMTVGIGK